MLAILLAQSAPPAATPTEPAEQVIVVTARKRKCSAALADRVLNDREFDARAAEWAAGTPVRVVAPRGADYACLAKIVFRLQSRGVTRVTFD